MKGTFVDAGRALAFPTQIESKEPSTSFVSTGAGGTKPGYLPIGVPVVILPYEQAGDTVMMWWLLVSPK